MGKIQFQNISTDTRTIKKGQIFLAIKGENFDGHDYIEEAFKKGASLAIADKRIKINKPIIYVNDTLETYGQIAKWWRQKFNIPVIAITGSNGKTTVKNMVASILKQKYNVLFPEESFNNFIGVPATILKLNAKHNILVLELGTNTPGEIDYLRNIAQPTISAITNIGPTHLEKFININNIKKEKENIFKGAKIKIGPSKIKDPEEQNKDTATRIAKAMRMSEKNIKKGLESYIKPKMRLEEIKRDKLTFINDAYNSNPVSLNYALEILSQKRGRKIAVLGDMLELGKNSDQLHRSIKIPENIDILITFGKKAKLIGGKNYKSHKDVSGYLNKIIKSGDVILLKASRGMQLEKVLDYVKYFTK